MKNPGIFYYMFFIGAGILSLVAGVVNYLHEQAIFAAAEQDTATLTRYVRDPNPKVADFCPEFEFTTKAGQAVTYIGDRCLSQPDPSKIGQHEQVYIDPKNPQSIQTRGWLGSEGSGLILGMLGCVFFPAISVAWVVSDFLGLSVRGRMKRNVAPIAMQQQAAADAMAQQRAEQRAQIQPITSSAGDSVANLLAQADSLKVQAEKLKTAEAELQRKIEERRRQKGQ